MSNRISWAYGVLRRAFGPQGWWPSESTFETAVGAVLTQGTAWSNAERAVARLRDAGGLTPEAVVRTTARELERLVAPAGFQRRKADTIARLARLVGGTTRGWSSFLALEAGEIRESLLDVRGIGPETADAILLYAASRPSLVVDTYTIRFAARHSLAAEGAGYEEVKALFERSLPRDAELLGEFHALVVELGKRYCRVRPLCDECPLRTDLRDGR